MSSLEDLLSCCRPSSESELKKITDEINSHLLFLPKELVKIIYYYWLDLGDFDIKEIIQNSDENTADIITTLYPFQKSKTINLCVKYNKIKLAKQLVSKGFPRTAKLFAALVSEGNIKEITDWIDSKFPTYENLHHNESEYAIENENAYVKAIKTDNFDIVKLLHEKKVDENGSVIKEAFAKGDIKLAKWLLEKDFTYNPHMVAPVSTMEALLWAEEIDGKNISEDKVLDEMARYGNYEIIKYMTEHKYEKTTWAFSLAVLNGNHRIIRYMLRNKFPINYETAWECAFQNGKISTLNLLKKKLPLPNNCNDIAYCDHDEKTTIKALDWAKKNHIPFRTHRLSELAAREGNYAVICWLIVNDYYDDEFYNVCVCGHYKIAKMLLNTEVSLFDISNVLPHMNIFGLLEKNNFPTDEVSSWRKYRLEHPRFDKDNDDDVMKYLERYDPQ